MNDDLLIFFYNLQLSVSAILAVYVPGIRSIPKIYSIAHYCSHFHLVQVQCTHYVGFNYQAFLLKQISKSQTDGISDTVLTILQGPWSLLSRGLCQSP